MGNEVCPLKLNNNGFMSIKKKKDLKPCKGLVEKCTPVDKQCFPWSKDREQ